LLATPDRLIQTGFSSLQAANNRGRHRLRRAAIGVAITAVAIGLARDAGPPRLRLAPVGFDRLAGWADDNVAAALPAFVKSCTRFLTEPNSAVFGPIGAGVDFGQIGDWRSVCRDAAMVLPGNDRAARQFFEGEFTPMAVADSGAREGLFTGYFEIELNGSRRRHGPYQTPIYRRLPDLDFGPRYSRAEIEDGALAGRGLELLWVDDPIDAFFLQIQGSGRVRLEDGQTIRLGYDGQNGLPYVPVGRFLVERGQIPREKLTMASIRNWMHAHSEAGAALRREDPSYVFFHEVKGDAPIGAEKIVLTPARSLAVDRTYIPLGAPIWLDADEQFVPNMSVRRLVVAQDTGGAIKGPVRGDLFWGAGRAAGDRAGEMDARGRYYLLLPRGLAGRLFAEESRR
jgi:membrane-bound lytic murein transglycosylase A